MIEYVDIARAKEATTGVRIVVQGQVPSPWSEATKGLFRLAGVPVLAVRSSRAVTPEVIAWTGIDNVPVVLHDAEPARTGWAAITALAARLSGDDALLPRDPRARADVMGMIELVAGEDGLGWNGRTAMIDTALTEQRGFPGAVAGYLAKRYAYSSAAAETSRARAEVQLGVLHGRLAHQRELGYAYFGGERPSALDVYVATFLTPLCAISEAACPSLSPLLRAAFGTAHERLGGLVTPELAMHRTRMLEEHLGYPIVL